MTKPKPALTEREKLIYKRAYTLGVERGKDRWRAELNELRRDKRRLDALFLALPLNVVNTGGQQHSRSLCLNGRTLRDALDDLRGTKR